MFSLLRSKMHIGYREARLNSDILEFSSFFGRKGLRGSIEKRRKNQGPRHPAVAACRAFHMVI